MAAKDKRTGLTPKQEKFANLLVTEETQIAAYTKAFKPQTSTTKTIMENASRLANRSNIQARVNNIQQRMARKMEVTQESLVRELEQSRQMAIEERQSSSMTAATLGKARVCGLDKVVIAGDTAAPITLIQRVIVDSVVKQVEEIKG